LRLVALIVLVLLLIALAAKTTGRSKEPLRHDRRHEPQ
jgi:hypothetical protein